MIVNYRQVILKLLPANIRHIARKLGVVELAELLLLPATVEKKINDHRIEFTVNDLLYYLYYEPDAETNWWLDAVSEDFRDHINTGDVVVDVGANQGYFTVLAATEAGDGGEVFAFEPMPRNLLALTRNIGQNELPGSQFISPTALADENQPIEMTAHRPRMGVQSDSTVDSQSKRFDSISGVQPDIVKIDVEGAEYSVLKGMIETLREDHPTIFLEVHEPKAIAEIGGTIGQLYESLNELGYQLNRVERDGEVVDDVEDPPDHSEIHFLFAQR